MADKYADRITAALNDFLLAKDSIIFNEYYIGGFRSDVIELNSDFEIVEYEIKTSVGDYKNDFLKTNKSGDNKHDLIQYGGLSNRFYFVFPPHLIPEDDVPEHCGILHFTGDTFITIRESSILYPVEMGGEANHEDILKCLIANESTKKIIKYHKFRGDFYKAMYDNIWNMNTKWYNIVSQVQKIVSPDDPF